MVGKFSFNFQSIKTNTFDTIKVFADSEFEGSLIKTINEFDFNEPFIFLNIPQYFSVGFIKEDKICLIRDVFGNVPLYYFTNNESIFFSDNILDLINLKEFNKRINFQEAHGYLNSTCQGTSYKESTIWENIYSVIPGQILTFDLNETKKYINFFQLAKSEPSHLFNIENFKEIFFNNLKLLLNKNRKLASSLSGGLDSSSIASGLQYLSSEKIVTIESRGNGEKNPERPYAQSVVDKWNTEHFIIDNSDLIDSNCFDTEKSICSTTGLPSHPYSMGINLIRILEKLEKLNCTDYYMGHGGDDVLIARGHYIDNLFENKDWVELRKSFIKFNNLYKSNSLPKYQYSLICIIPIMKALISGFKFIDLFKFYFTSLNFELKCVLNFKILELLFKRKSKIKSNNIEKLYLFECKTTFNSNDHLSLITKNLYAEKVNYIKEIFRINSFKNREQSYILGQKFGVKFRYPFYNLELMNLISNSSQSLNFGDGLGRNILRESMKDVLPEIVRKRINKTEFSNSQFEFFVSLYKSAKLNFRTNHKIWSFINQTQFLEIGDHELESFKNKKGSLNTILQLIKIIYFGIWLELYFPE